MMGEKDLLNQLSWRKILILDGIKCCKRKRKALRIKEEPFSKRKKKTKGLGQKGW